MKKTILTIVFLSILVLIVGFLAKPSPVQYWQDNEVGAPTDGRDMFPASVQAAVAADPYTQVKRCDLNGQAYFVTDAVMIADEGNDVYDSNGVKVDSCFGFTTPEMISPFCNALGGAPCVVLYTPDLSR